MIDYDLEIDDVVKNIGDNRLVCIQLPDGLKEKAGEIVDAVENKIKATTLIWAGSCFGACDYPDLSHLGVDLLLQWGHSGPFIS